MKKRYIAALMVVLAAQSALYSSDFLNSAVHLNFGGMYTLAASGNILDSENSAIQAQMPDNSNVSHYETAYCATIDIVPTNPIILGMEDHAVKFGLRGSYRFHFLEQRVTQGSEIGDQVMKYTSWMLGPVIHYAPYIEPSDLNQDYTATGGLTFYALWGRINGDLTAYPAIRKKNLTIPVSDNNTKVTGNKFDIGIGAEIALCSLNVGVNIYYSYAKFTMKDKVYADLGRTGYLKEGCLELYVGIPIGSFIEPLIPKF